MTGRWLIDRIVLPLAVFAALPVIAIAGLVSIAGYAFWCGALVFIGLFSSPHSHVGPAYIVLLGVAGIGLFVTRSIANRAGANRGDSTEAIVMVVLFGWSLLAAAWAAWMISSIG